MKHGQERRNQPLALPRQGDLSSDSERSAAQSFRDRITEYNAILATGDIEAAEVYAWETRWVSRNEYREARG